MAPSRPKFLVLELRCRPARSTSSAAPATPMYGLWRGRIQRDVGVLHQVRRPSQVVKTHCNGFEEMPLRRTIRLMLEPATPLQRPISVLLFSLMRRLPGCVSSITSIPPGVLVLARPVSKLPCPLWEGAPLPASATSAGRCARELPRPWCCPATFKADWRCRARNFGSGTLRAAATREGDRKDARHVKGQS
jgi:hypothetical protein